MPSPLGRVPVRVEGQTDTPINHVYLGEVLTHTTPKNTDLPQPSVFSLLETIKTAICFNAIIRVWMPI